VTYIDPKYLTLEYGHSQHRRYVRGCEDCLKRTREAQRRYTESRRRSRAYNKRNILTEEQP